MVADFLEDSPIERAHIGLTLTNGRDPLLFLPQKCKLYIWQPNIFHGSLVNRAERTADTAVDRRTWTG